MNELTNTLIENGMQCWTCPIFDNLFAIISNAAAAVYTRLTIISVVIFSVLFGLYVLNAFWQNMKSGMSDPMFQKSLKPVLIKSLFILSLLALGVAVPKFISRITFEPTAAITLQFSEAMLPNDYKVPDNYSAIKLNPDGFFNSELRDTIVQILQTNVANFQVYIKTSIAIIEESFSIKKITDLGLEWIIKRLLIFFVGLFLLYNFTKWFIKYSFCFMDVIIAMAMFAFFFPLSLIFFIFQGASDVPNWMKNLGKNFGGKQIKELINAIVSVVSTILVYTIAMILVSGYLNGRDLDINSITNVSDSMLNFDFDNPNINQLTFFGIIVLVFIVNYLIKEIPNIKKEIMSAFGVSQNDKAFTEMGENVFKLTNIVTNQAKQFIGNIAHPDNKPDSEKKPATKGKDNKK